MERKLRELQQRRAAEEAESAKAEAAERLNSSGENGESSGTEQTIGFGDSGSSGNSRGLGDSGEHENIRMTPKGFTPTLHRGSFRESHEENLSPTQRASRQSKAAFWVVLLLMLALLYWLL